MKDFPCFKQLETTDAQFLDFLKLPGRAGEDLAAARAAQDASKALRIVAAHFRTRSAPAWSYYMHGTPWLENDATGNVVEKSEGLRNLRYKNSWPPHNEFSFADAGGKANWRTAVEQASTAVGRGTFVAELSTAYSLTGNPVYAQTAVKLMHSFVEQVPFDLDPRFYDDHDAYFGGDANHTLTVTYRIFRWIDFLYSGALQVPGVVSDEDVFWIVKQLWFYAGQFYRLCGDAMRRDNHHLVDHGHVAFCTALMFPEFSFSKEWLDYGAKVIRHHFSQNLLPDGGYAEHSCGYQSHIIFHFFHPLGVARANNYKLFTASQVEAIKRWAEFNARLCKPDGRLPEFGDETGRTLAHFFGSLAAVVMDERLANMGFALGFQPGKHITGSAADLTKKFSAWTSGTPLLVGITPHYLKKGQPTTPKAKLLPTPASKCFPYGGYTFFRSHWAPDADYLAVSHFSDKLIGGHAHWDPLSFLLHTKGETLIGDPATWIYTDKHFAATTWQAPAPHEDQKLHRGYSYSVNAHNCLTMNNDFLKPMLAMSHGTFWGGSPPLVPTGLFETAGDLEVLEAWHDEYKPTRHRRFVVHLRGLGYVFVDHLWRKMLDLRPNQYTQYYHLDYEVEVSAQEPAKQSALKVFKGAASCLLVPGSESGSEWRTIRDELLTDIHCPYRTSKGVAPWIVALTRTTRGPAVFTTFLLTGGADGFTAAPTPRYLGKQASEWFGWQPEALSANALDLGPHGSLFVASCPYGKALESDELSTDADLAVVWVTPQGKVKAWGAAYGSKLLYKGKRLLGGKQVKWKAG